MALFFFFSKYYYFSIPNKVWRALYAHIIWWKNFWKVVIKAIVIIVVKLINDNRFYGILSA